MIYIIFLINISKEIIIQNAVYNLVYKNYYFNYENLTLQISDSLKEEINSNFRIISTINNSFYYIQHINTNLYLLTAKNNTNILLLGLINKNDDLGYWNFIHTGNNNYKIFNKNHCYIKIRKKNIFCENILLNKASEFNFIKIYEEINENDKLKEELIEKEPIDVLIKYIDLRDPYLKRTGIHQIKKDLDNEELRYCIRSILKNIPWVRKIFILMPNEKVRYFKDYNLINDKIIYIKDKDILGYDSSNSLAFQYRYWKMVKFGISNNFISMDDDYFIGNPLNKSDFFYVKEGKVTPFLVTSKFTKISKSSAQQKLRYFKSLIKKSDKEQTSPIFRYSLYLTYLLILKLFKKYSLFIPMHTHNAIPINVDEIKEVYDIINNSEYKSGTLNSLYRPIINIQFQTFVTSYCFLKYNKKVRNLTYKLINNRDSINNIDYSFSLFCINTGSINYRPSSFMKTRIVLEYLFPIPSPYEIINNNLPILAFDSIFLNYKEFKLSKYKIKKKNQNLEIEIKEFKNQIKIILYFYFLLILFIFKIINSFCD